MRSLQPSEIGDWVRSELLDPQRSRPIVAVTTSPSTGRYWIEPGGFEERIGEWADVVALETGDATWELADALPGRLDVYGGAMRVWWPGLTRESNPYDHKLYLLRSEEEAQRRAAVLESELRRRARPGADAEGRGVVTTRPSRTPPTTAPETVTAFVTSTSGEILVEDADGVAGRVVEADVPLDAVAVCLREGQEIIVSRPVGWQSDRGAAPCSLRGRLPSPWVLVGEALRNGDVVQGRVVAILPKYALIELVPDAKGIVGLAEVDHTFVRHIGDFLEIDELVRVQILELDAAGGRAQLSVKSAQIASGAPRPLPSLVPGGKPFEWPVFLERAGVAFREKRDERDERIDELEQELAAANEDRAALRRSLTDLRREYKSLEGRYGDMERRASGELDPLSDERAFLRAVRLAYARSVDEGERLERPLLAMRVGPEFLARARALQGVSVEKIVEVAAQVACEQAHEIDGREVHPMGESSGGSKQRVRARDGAKAWRCALQVKTPSARRLHWWRIPGPHGATLEFASVAVHDDFDIPE
jgi:predicted RNA-binding protein with RPS1 domain